MQFSILSSFWEVLTLNIFHNNKTNIHMACAHMPENMSESWSIIGLQFGVIWTKAKKIMIVISRNHKELLVAPTGLCAEGLFYQDQPSPDPCIAGLLIKPVKAQPWNSTSVTRAKLRGSRTARTVRKASTGASTPRGLP